MPNETTGLSQHETLVRLSNVRNASVHYVCPMIFSVDEIYEEPDVDKLRIVDLKSAPTELSSDERHFIAFQDVNSNNTKWCTDPVPAKCRTVEHWLHSPYAAPMRMSKRWCQVIYFLFSLLTTTKNSLVVDLAARMLGRLKDSRAVDALLEKLESKDNIYYVIIALGEINDPRTIDPLVKILKDTGFNYFS